jgi:hypothetical protein
MPLDLDDATSLVLAAVTAFDAAGAEVLVRAEQVSGCPARQADVEGRLTSFMRRGVEEPSRRGWPLRARAPPPQRARQGGCGSLARAHRAGSSLRT